MGYRISYEKKRKEILFENKEKKSKKRKLIGIIVMLLVIISFFLLQNRNIRRTFLPGNGAVTEKAIEHFVYSIQNGTGVGEAVSTFCREIVACAE